MPIYLEIAVNVPQVSGVFHYHLPPELEGRVETGLLVEVPFGQQRVQGVVLRFVDQPAVPTTRPVLGVVDAQAVLTPLQIALAVQLSESTLGPLASWVGLMLPPGLAQLADTLYSREEAAFPPDRSAGAIKTKLVGLLEKRGPLRGRQIDTALPHLEWRRAARILVMQGILSARPVLPPPAVQPKVVRTVQLACPPEAAEARLAALGRVASPAHERRRAMLRFLLREPGPVDVAWVFAAAGGGSQQDLRRMAEAGVVILGESEAWRDPLERLVVQPNQPPPLTRDQQACWEQVRHGLEARQAVAPYLLHGVTGSGKTEIYLQAAAETIRLGRQAIILVPEISLTPQTVRRFVARFPGRVGLVHSRLSAGERYDTWRRARAGELSVIVGPRSALFTPLPDPGLIVLDEFHDDSYYQAEPPYYHAREAAVAYARLAGGVCLLGSATPDVASAYLAAQGRWQPLELPARILGHRQVVQAQAEQTGGVSYYQPLEAEAQTIDLPPVRVVDMRQELKAGNRSIFSRALQEGLRRTLERGEQAILFLNRRGSASYVFCRDCGYVLKCPRCDLPLAYHEDHAENGVKQLVCHHCGYRRQMPSQCPACKGSHVRPFGIGTERVESEVQALLPGARTLRWDYETTRHKGAHEIILAHFAAHRADVLVGTQMLAKGLDLPLVTLVGVVLADVGLNLPDYRAGERTFQVLTQVAGRAGRSPLGGQVVLQTFEPDHYVIRAAAGHDYAAFYQQELEYRRRLGYPPFTRLARLEVRHPNSAQAESAANELAAQVRGWLAAGERRATEIIGPVPCFFARLDGQYRWQVILRGPDPASILRNRALADWRLEINPPSLL